MFAFQKTKKHWFSCITDNDAQFACVEYVKFGFNYQKRQIYAIHAIFFL